jgi:hypothetical protein
MMPKQSARCVIVLRDLRLVGAESNWRQLQTMAALLYKRT